MVEFRLVVRAPSPVGSDTTIVDPHAETEDYVPVIPAKRPLERVAEEEEEEEKEDKDKDKKKEKKQKKKQKTEESRGPKAGIFIVNTKKKQQS